MNIKEKYFTPRHPELFTPDELSSWRKGLYISTGKIALGPVGIVVITAGAITESIPATATGLAIAAYGLLSGTYDTVKLADIERDVSARPQAEALPLEYND